MANHNNNVEEIDLLEICLLMWHRIWILVAAGLLGAIAMFIVTAFAISPKYESSTGIYIMNVNSNDTISYSDTQLASQLTKDYEELIVCRYVIETVIEKCDLEESYKSLLSRVSVNNTTGTRIITITVKDESPERAKEIADNIRNVASEHIKAVTNVEAVTVVDEANLPTTPSEPSILKNTVIGGLLGIVFAAAVIIILFIVDDTIKTEEDVEKYLGLSILALIPVTEKSSSKSKKVRTVNQKTKKDSDKAKSRRVDYADIND